MHAVGQFVRRDPRGDGRIVRVLDAPQFVEPADEVDAAALACSDQGVLGPGVVEGAVWIDPQRHGVVGGPEVVAVALVPILPRAHRHELREVLVERPEPVMHPGAEVGEVAVVLVAAGVELRLRAVVAVGGPQRAHERQAVSVRGDVGKPIADFHTALPVLAEAHLERKERVALVAVGVGHHQAFEGQFLRILHRGERGLGDGLARVLREHGLRVEALHVADPAVHEEPDHVLGLWREVRAAVGGRPQGRAGRSGFSLEERAEGQAGEPHAQVGEEGPSGAKRRLPIGRGQWVRGPDRRSGSHGRDGWGGRPWVHRSVTKSPWLTSDHTNRARAGNGASGWGGAWAF